MPKRKCKQCKEFTEKFIQVPAGVFCNMEHAVTFACEASKKKRAKALAEKKREFNRETKRRKSELKSRSEWLKDAQTIFNRYIRLRDSGQPCISCQNKTPKKINAGHYKSVGAHPELRFEECQVHLQCEHCNSFKSGNQVEYRKHLINKIGADKVEWIEGPHKPKKYTIEELKELKKVYQDKIKALQNEG